MIKLSEERRERLSKDLNDLCFKCELSYCVEERQKSKFTKLICIRLAAIEDLRDAGQISRHTRFC